MFAINLAGRSVNCRYTTANRRSIHASRTISTRLLNEVIARLNRAPRLWIQRQHRDHLPALPGSPHERSRRELGGSEPGAPDTWNFSIDVAKAWKRHSSAP